MLRMSAEKSPRPNDKREILKNSFLVKKSIILEG